MPMSDGQPAKPLLETGRVSIIVPAHNAEGTLEQCLTACLQQTCGKVEVIVVDDGSTDDTARIAQSFPVECLSQTQRGPAAARNAGARHAHGDILLYTDSDCVPNEDWVEQLLSGFGDGVAAVGGTYGIANPESLLARLVHEEIMVRHERYDAEVDFLGSFNVAYCRNAFEEAGGFDEDFGMASGEDNDLAYRLADAGGRLRFVLGAIVKHHHPSRLFPYLRSQKRHGFWRMKLYAKHPRRSGGDRYAGIADLLAPGLVSLLAITVALGLLVGFQTWVAPALLLLFGVLLVSRFPVPLRMMRRTRDPRMLTFVPIMLLRDGARAIGMVHGIWTFFVLRRKTV